MNPCTIPDCTKLEMAKGLCSGHYQRKRVHGHPMADVPLRPSGRKLVEFGTCSVKSCERRSRVSGRDLCSTHYQRWRKHGDPLKTIKNTTGRSLNANGYVLLATGSTRMMLEHRVVMEQIVGRPLHANENVHHKNGDRADNRPENLELWITRQPKGQRVSDQVEWAQQLLSRYAPELLAEG